MTKIFIEDGEITHEFTTKASAKVQGDLYKPTHILGIEFDDPDEIDIYNNFKENHPTLIYKDENIIWCLGVETEFVLPDSIDISEPYKVRNMLDCAVLLWHNLDISEVHCKVLNVDKRSKIFTCESLLAKKVVFEDNQKENDNAETSKN